MNFSFPVQWLWVDGKWDAESPLVPTLLPFKDASAGMRVTMTPEGCLPGRDVFTGTIIRGPNCVRG